MDHSSLSNITKEEFDASVSFTSFLYPSSPSTHPFFVLLVQLNSQVSHSISLLPPPTPPTHSASPSSQHPSTLQPFSHTDTGEEPALPISSTASSSLQNMERFFLRTGEAVSRPLNAIGKIFSDALDGPADPPSGSYRIGGDSHGHGHEGGGGLGPGGGVPYAYEARRRSPRPRSFIGLPPTSNDQQQYYPQQQQQGNQNQGTWRGETAPGVQPWREPPPGLGGEEEEGEIDFERLQVELDKRDELARFVVSSAFLLLEGRADRCVLFSFLPFFRPPWPQGRKLVSHLPFRRLFYQSVADSFLRSSFLHQTNPLPNLPQPRRRSGFVDLGYEARGSPVVDRCAVGDGNDLDYEEWR